MGIGGSKADSAMRRIAEASLEAEGKVDLSEEELEALWNKYDENHNGELEEGELVKFLGDLRAAVVKAIAASGSEAAVKAADELQEELSGDAVSTVAASLLAQMDVNQDGKVTKNEFFEKWREVYAYRATHVPAAASGLHVKLTYFDLRGLGEKIRIVLEAAAIPYEDVRLQGGDWESLKGTMPFGQVPAVEVTEGDSTLDLVQSTTIVRYLARKSGLLSGTLEDQAKVEMLLDGIEDLRMKMIRVFYSPEFSSLKDELVEKTIPGQLELFENLLQRAGSESGFFHEKLTVADLIFFEVLEIVEAFAPGSLNGFEAVTRHHKQVAGLPRIDAYLKSGRRPTQINGGSAQWNP